MVQQARSVLFPALVVMAAAVSAVAQSAPTFVDSCVNALIVSEGVYAYDTTGYTIAGPPTTCAIPVSGPFDGWLAYTPSGTGFATFSNCPSSTVAPGGSANAPFDSLIAIWSAASCPPTMTLACVDGSLQCGIDEAELTIPVTAGSTYYVQIGHWANTVPATGSVAISILGVGGTTGPGFADSCTTAPNVSEGVYTYNTVGYSVAGPYAPCSISNPDPFDGWIAYTPSGTGIATFSNCPISANAPGGSAVVPADTVIAVWSAGNCPPTTMFGCADHAPVCMNGQSELTLPVLAGTTYYVQIGNWALPKPMYGAVAIALAGAGGTPGPGDDCTTAHAVSGPGTFVFPQATAAIGRPASCALNVTPYDQWIAYSAATTGICYASTCPVSTSAPGGNNNALPLFMTAHAACPVATGVEVACASGQIFTCGLGGAAEIGFPCIAGTTYFIQVGCLNALTSVVGVGVAFAESPPVTVVNPANGHSYMLTPVPSTFQSARSFAAAMGGFLVTVNDVAEKNWLQSTFIGQSFWIGLSDEVVEGAFVWDNGEPVNYLHWCGGQPDDLCGLGGEDYVQMVVNCSGQWNDYSDGACGSNWALGVVEIGATVIGPPTSSLGSVVTYDLYTGSPYSIYWFDVSLTGSTPGVSLPGGKVIPLNEPWLNFATGFGDPTFVNFLGVTNAAGTAQTQVILPDVPWLGGYVLTASFAVIDLSLPTFVKAVAPPVGTILLGAPPVINTFSPTSGPAAGGTTVTVVGTGFQSGAVVKFGGVPATIVSVGPTAISCVAPPGTIGAKTVQVINADGQSATAAGSFTYAPNLVLMSVAPSIAATGTMVTVGGSGFQTGMTATVGGAPLALLTQTPTSATFLYPAGTPCGTTFALTNPGGQSASLPFNPSPVVSGAFFPSGTHLGGQPYFLSGLNFVPGTTVTIRGAAATITTLTAVTIFMTTPPGPVGPAAVVVTSPSGCTTSTTYTYL